MCNNRSISAMIGIPDAVTLELQSPFLDRPCVQDVTFDLSSCTPSWSEKIDFSFTIAKAVLLYTIPLCFMIVAYCHIVRTLWRRQNVPGGSNNNSNSNNNPNLVVTRNVDHQSVSAGSSSQEHHQHLLPREQSPKIGEDGQRIRNGDGGGFAVFRYYFFLNGTLTKKNWMKSQMQMFDFEQLCFQIYIYIEQYLLLEVLYLSCFDSQQ